MVVIVGSGFFVRCLLYLAKRFGQYQRRRFFILWFR
jgi:hypothetical protein